MKHFLTKRIVFIKSLNKTTWLNNYKLLIFNTNFFHIQCKTYKLKHKDFKT